VGAINCWGGCGKGGASAEGRVMMAGGLIYRELSASLQLRFVHMAVTHVILYVAFVFFHPPARIAILAKGRVYIYYRFS